MVHLMPGRDVRQCADGYFVLIDNAAPHPGRFVQVAKKGERGAAYRDVVFDDLGQGAVIEWRVADVIILLEAGQRGLVPAANAEGSIREDALSVAHVSEQFFHAPLAGRIADVAIFFFAATQKDQHLSALRIERREDVVSLHLGNVAYVIGGVLTGFRSTNL